MSNQQSSFKNSISKCSWISSFWAASADADWIQKPPTSAAPEEGQPLAANENDVLGVHLSDSIRVKLSPSTQGNRKKQHARNVDNFQWQESHFHPQFKADDSDGFVLLFQAMARESMIVALSSRPGFASGMFEIIFGGAGNTVTMIRKRTSGAAGRKTRKQLRMQISVPSRVCREDAWVSYWVCLHKDKIFVGTGNVPGNDCFGIFDATTADKTADSSKDEADETNEQRGAEEQQPKEETKDDKGQVIIQEIEPSVEEDAHSTTVKDTLKNEEPKPSIQYVGFGNAAKPGSKQHVQVQNVLLTNLPPFLMQILKEIPSQDDLPIVVLPAETLESKKLLQILRDYKADYQARKARAIKYGTEYQEQTLESFLPWTTIKRLRENPEKGFATGLDLMDPKEREKQAARKARFSSEGANNDTNVEATTDKVTEMEVEIDRLPPEQAWDKETMLRPMRTDPPPYLWKNADSDAPAEPDPFAMEPPKLANWVPEKLHLSSLDWAAFKQIRNQDIMSYFGEYRPSYVEWLGDISCNVCFEDRYTAARALQNFSNDIPTPIPDWILEKSNGKSNEIPDLGNMTWRLGKSSIRKVANDRYGRKGTTARVLMRVATSEDILLERPNKWPAPPGGFSSSKVLGPDSDFAPKKGQSKHTQQRHDQNETQQQTKQRTGTKNKRIRHEKGSTDLQGRKSAEKLLDSGLSSGRAGFSVEDMERERAAKKQRVEKS